MIGLGELMPRELYCTALELRERLLYIYVRKDTGKIMQISAEISKSTKQLLERYSRAHGIKKQFLIESALLHHIQALEELPSGVIVAPRLVVSAASGRKIVELLSKRQKPTRELAELMRGGD